MDESRGLPGAWLLRVKRLVDAALMAGFDRLLGRLARPLLRHITGHWPRQPELSDFRRGYGERQDRLPPLLNGFASTERFRPYAIDTMIAATRSARSTPGQAARHRRTAGAPIAFLHLEKTAGTSLAEFLERRFSPMLIMPLPDNVDEALAQVQDPAVRAYTILHGHFTLPFLRTHAPERHVVTFLRDPAARLLSCYYYWRSRQLSSTIDDVNEAAVLASRLGLLDFLQCDLPVVVSQIDNMYAHRLTGVCVLSGRESSDGRALDLADQALAALDSVAFVGITERFAESLDLLSAWLGLVPPRIVPRTNVGEQNVIDLPEHFTPVPREPITPAITAELDRLTRIDRVIYNAAVRKLDTMSDRPAA